MVLYIVFHSENREILWFTITHVQKQGDFYNQFQLKLNISLPISVQFYSLRSVLMIRKGADSQFC